jgi:hypothetical protein
VLYINISCLDLCKGSKKSGSAFFAHHSWGYNDIALFLLETTWKPPLASTLTFLMIRTLFLILLGEIHQGKQPQGKQNDEGGRSLMHILCFHYLSLSPPHNPHPQQSEPSASPKGKCPNSPYCLKEASKHNLIRYWQLVKNPRECHWNRILDNGCELERELSGNRCLLCFLFLFLLFGLFVSGWPGTSDPPASTSQMLGL